MRGVLHSLQFVASLPAMLRYTEEEHRSCLFIRVATQPERAEQLNVELSCRLYVPNNGEPADSTTATER